MIKLRASAMAAAAVLATWAMPALADVKAGVDAWSRGDYDRAVSEWRAPAQAGDPDAMFNLAQAYRLGRGVSQDAAQAERLYKRAAQQGHLKAADNLGLLLFQAGRREEAMPYVTGASERGDPRAQYLLGIAHFNGDLVEKDWVRAYALLTLANAAGLPQAAPAIRQMDDFIPLEQRQQAQALAPNIKREADSRRASQLAAVDLATGGAQSAAAPPPATRPEPSPARAALPARPQDIPRPIPSTTVAPSVVSAQAAVAEAARVTGTENPAEAGADFARSSSPAPARATPPAPRQVAAATPAPRRPAPTPAPAAARAAGGPWKVQLGAFSVRGNAERLWSRLSSRSELSGAERLLVPAGRVTKLQAGGYSSRSAAQTACNSLKRSGQDCLVTR